MDVASLLEDPQKESNSQHIAKKQKVETNEEEERIARRIWSAKERSLKQPTTLEGLLSSREVGEYVKQEKDLITIDSETVVSNVLKTLIDNKIHSAPIFDSKEQSYIGFVDLLDIMVWVMETFPEKKDGDLLELLKNEDKWFTTRARDIIDESEKDPFKPLDKSASLLQACQTFAKGVHRIPVVDSSNTFYGVLTQTCIIQLFSMYLDAFDELADKTLNQLHLSSGVVLYASQSDITIEAFKLLSQWKITGIPVVVDKESNVLCGCLSVDDMRIVLKDHFTYGSLFEPVSSFIASCRSSFPTSTCPAVFCSKDDTLATAIRIMASNHVHRLYVTDSAGKLCGVMTLNDILRMLPALLAEAAH